MQILHSSGNHIRRLYQATVSLPPFLANGLVYCFLQIWRLPDLVLVSTLRGHKRGVWAAQFSPVDQAVATASGDKTLRLWALADGSCLKTFEGHTASVLRLNFLSAGTQARSYCRFAICNASAGRVHVALAFAACDPHPFA